MSDCVICNDSSGDEAFCSVCMDVYANFRVSLEKASELTRGQTPAEATRVFHAAVEAASIAAETRLKMLGKI